MQITIPVPYKLVARINRSRTGRTEEAITCTQETFSIRSEPSTDVHLVAEWQQKWNEPNRDQWTPNHSSNWLHDFQADNNLSRLIMIDGAFYSPLMAKIDSDQWQIYTPDDFAAQKVDELRSVMEREYGGF